jgi:hypothetical protein
MLVADQLELIADHPGEAAIRIYQCRQCGAARACRPSWTTRCHVCLDERSTGEIVAMAAQQFLSRLENDPVLTRQTRQLLQLGPTAAVSPRQAVEASALISLTEQLHRFDRPGWSVLATDVHGLPWFGVRRQHHSHGTWARHENCGTVAKLHSGTVDCPTCGPEPGSRTHEGRKNDPYLLYLVRTRRWQKFGVGDQRRVKQHLRGGAQVVQVLQAPFAQVVLAEELLKQQNRDAIIRRAKRGMISSFGQGTEVMRTRTTISLSRVLPDGEDVTHWFR